MTSLLLEDVCDITTTTLMMHIPPHLQPQPRAHRPPLPRQAFVSHGTMLFLYLQFLLLPLEHAFPLSLTSILFSPPYTFPGLGPTPLTN
jgi:hypothetical protein